MNLFINQWQSDIHVLDVNWNVTFDVADRLMDYDNNAIAQQKLQWAFYILNLLK